jgi:hypothetical protein
VGVEGCFDSLLFGVAIWLLWGAILHVVIRLMGRSSDFDRILNMVGLATLIPAPAVWIWTCARIAQNVWIR